MKEFILLFSTFLLSFSAMAQNVAISNDGSEPAPSAMLDVISADKGILIPRVAFANRPVNPATGLLIYQTDNGSGFYYFREGKWIKMADFTQSDWAETNAAVGAYIKNKPDKVSDFHNEAGYLTFEMDADTSNELQTLSKTGYQIALSIGGGSVTDAVDDADADPSNELQNLYNTKNENLADLTISGGTGTTIDVSDADNEPLNELQTLTKENDQTVTLSNAGHWTSPNTGATNYSGFTGLPGGGREDDGTFSGIGDDGLWWSSTEDSSGYAWVRNLYYYDGGVEVNSYNKRYGFSVRCLRD